jgi:hypothetical protein
MTDWARWHDDYDDPGSRLAQRLRIVAPPPAVCEPSGIAAGHHSGQLPWGPGRQNSAEVPRER